MTSVTGQEYWTKADLPDPASTRLYSHTLLPRQEVQAPRPAPQEDQGHQEGALRPREVPQDCGTVSPGLGRPEVATLRAGGITDYNSLFCFRDLLFVFKIERKMNGRLNS